MITGLLDERQDYRSRGQRPKRLGPRRAVPVRRPPGLAIHCTVDGTDREHLSRRKPTGPADSRGGCR